MPRRTSSSVGFGCSPEQGDGGQDLPRRAEAALERVVLDERRLHAVGARRRAPSPSIVVIDGPAHAAVSVRHEYAERAVDQHGACAALAAAAHELRAGEVRAARAGSSSSVSWPGAATSWLAPLTIKTHGAILGFVRPESQDHRGDECPTSSPKPASDVKDRACVDVCPVDCIYEGRSSCSSTPTSASIAARASRSAR